MRQTLPPEAPFADTMAHCRARHTPTGAGAARARRKAGSR